MSLRRTALAHFTVSSCRSFLTLSGIKAWVTLFISCGQVEQSHDVLGSIGDKTKIMSVQEGCMLHSCMVIVVHILHHLMLRNDLYIEACEHTFPSTSGVHLWPFEITVGVTCERYKTVECTKNILRKMRPKPWFGNGA